MATPSLLSPTSQSPRKPLQSLSTNLPTTPKHVTSKHMHNASPFANKVSLEPTTVLTLSDKYPLTSQVLNASKKRPFDEINTTQERDSSQTRASFTSFSSYIDYDPPTSQEEVSSASTVSAEAAGETSIKNRTDTLRLRLQMAMFRVQTGQLKVPLSNLQLPASERETAPLKDRAPSVLSLPSTPLQKRRRTVSDASSTDDDLPVATYHETTEAAETGQLHDDNLTSSAVKGRAISGLLELRRSS